MENADAGYADGMATECISDSWSWEVLTSLYGEIDPLLFAVDQPCDYSAVDQEQSLEIPSPS